MVSDPLVMPIARQALACYDLELMKVENPPAFVQLRPGGIVAHLISLNDDECCQGLGWVRPVTFFPSSGSFPGQDSSPQPKGPSAWSVTLELGAVRCAPTPEANRIPTGDEWDDTTQAVMDDAAAMRRAICCLQDLYGARRVLAGSWQPLDIQGGCVGGVIPVTILGPACDCAEAGETSS